MFELSRVRVSEGKTAVNLCNRCWFELARGSSYRESTVETSANLELITIATKKKTGSYF